MQHFKNQATLWIVTHELERSNPGLLCKIHLGKIFRNKSSVMVRAGKIATFKAEFLSVVADCDHGDQDQEDDQQAQSHPDDAGHGEALCNR